jgi:hypothetical protein
VSVDLSGVAELVTAVGGGGLAVAVIDRWLYRGRPRLDVAELAQRIAAETLQHASAEINRAWKAADRYQQQLAAVRAEHEQQLKQLRGEIRELHRRVDVLGEEKAVLVTRLRAAEQPG